MRQVTRKGLITAAAASGVLATFSGGTAFADGAQGASVGSPGVLSGNTVQVPVNVPVNACGTTVSIAGVLNPAMGNRCSNGSGASAHGTSQSSPGVGSGNTIQAPVNIPVNACGTTVSAAGTQNPALGNDCANGSGGGTDRPVHPWHPHHPGHPGHPGHPSHPGTPERPTTHKPVDMTPAAEEAPKADVRAISQPETHGALAQTGSGEGIGYAGALSAGLLIGGFVLYRRSRAAQR